MKNDFHQQSPEEKTNKIPPDFFLLVEEKLAGTLSPEGRDQLEKYLRENTDAFNYYVALYRTESDIPAALAAHAEAGTGDAGALPAAPEKRAAKTIPFARILAGAVAAVAVIAAAVFAPKFFISEPPEPVTAAGEDGYCRIAQVFGASAAGKRIESQTKLFAETLSVDTGVVELAFAQGARVLLEAPAAMAITGANSCRLVYGKAVADVPDSAKGFIMESPNDRVVDYGTRFGMHVSRDGKSTLLGVLSGIVDLEHAGETVRLFTNYAVERTGNSIKSVPFDQGKFLTEMPMRECTWNIDGLPFGEMRTMRFDVTHLIRMPGNISVIFKWLLGENGLFITKLSLERDGTAVIESDTKRRAGRTQYTHDNIFPLTLPENTPLSGKWELVIEATCTPLNTQNAETGTATSRGIILFEKGIFDEITPADFVGKWQFSHDDKTYVREIKADGTVGVTINGEPRNFGNDPPRWTFENGVLTMNRRDWHPERVVLRDKNTMIFLNQIFRDARRMPE